MSESHRLLTLSFEEDHPELGNLVKGPITTFMGRLGLSPESCGMTALALVVVAWIVCGVFLESTLEPTVGSPGSALLGFVTSIFIVSLPIAIYMHKSSEHYKAQVNSLPMRDREQLAAKLMVHVDNLKRKPLYPDTALSGDKTVDLDYVLVNLNSRIDRHCSRLTMNAAALLSPDAEVLQDAIGYLFGDAIGNNAQTLINDQLILQEEFEQVSQRLEFAQKKSLVVGIKYLFELKLLGERQL